MIDSIINIKILLSNGQNWVLTKQFIHSIQRKHNLIIVNLRDTPNHSFANKLFNELVNNKHLTVKSFSIKRHSGEEKFPMYNSIKPSLNRGSYTIQLIKDI